MKMRKNSTVQKGKERSHLQSQHMGAEAGEALQVPAYLGHLVRPCLKQRKQEERERKKYADGCKRATNRTIKIN